MSGTRWSYRRSQRRPGWSLPSAVSARCSWIAGTCCRRRRGTAPRHSTREYDARFCSQPHLRGGCRL